MMRGFTLEDFGIADSGSGASTAPAPAPAPAAGMSDAEREAARVAAYEDGYKSGWDDSARAVETEGKAVGEELARNLRDLGFTYFEARSELTEVMRAFIAELLDRLFPALLPEAVAASLAAEIAGLAEDACDGSMTVSVSPDDRATVERVMSEAGIKNATLREEPALASGQAQLRAGTAEVAIDAERIVRTLREALGPATKLEELKYG